LHISLPLFWYETYNPINWVAGTQTGPFGGSADGWDCIQVAVKKAAKEKLDSGSQNTLYSSV
jgi:hypothetical protein